MKPLFCDSIVRAWLASLGLPALTVFTDYRRTFRIH